MLYSLVDMMNLARTSLILGSGWSSYSEVAAYMGGVDGRPLPMLMAGRDFGNLIEKLTIAASQNDRSSATVDRVNTHIA